MANLAGQEAALELGTGCGIVSLLLACRYPRLKLTAVELQPSLADLARRNVLLNRLQDRITVVEADMAQLPSLWAGRTFPAILSNPPYRPLACGRINPDPERAVARHEVKGSLELVAQVAARLLAPGGRLLLIYPVWRLVHLLVTLRAHHLEPKKLRCLHSRQGKPAKLVFVEARQGSGEELRLEAPLVIYEEDGRYTPEVAAMLALASESRG